MKKSVQRLALCSLALLCTLDPAMAPADTADPAQSAAKSAAKPDDKTGPKPDAAPRCKKLLLAGRKLARKRDWKGAMASYSACLALDPKQAAVLSELGWAAYNDKDLVSAAKYTQQAIDAATETNLKGASYYNLGLIAEARGDKPGAIAAYSSSIKARQNPTVRARLAVLDPAAAAALDPFVPQPLSDPVASLQAFCKTRRAENRKVADEADKDYDGSAPKMRCSCSPAPIGDRDAYGSVGSIAASAPYKAIRVFKNKCTRGDGMDDLTYIDFILGVQTAAGWYTQDLVSVEDRHYCSEGVKDITLELKDVIPGGAPELLITWLRSYSCRSGESSESTYMRVLGIGPSGKPRMTPSIPLTTEEVPENEGGGDDDDPPAKVTAMTATFDKEGRLVLSNKEGARKHPDLGAHRLVFP